MMTHVERIAKICQVIFKTSMLNSSLCNYSDAYIFVKGTISIARLLASAAPDNFGEEVVFKNCARYTDCINEINNTQIHNAMDAIDIDIVMSMHNLIESSDNYSKTLGSLWQ